MKKLIAFFEIPATDFRRAVDFYETVLNMKLPVFECEQEKMACFTEDGETVGAISQSFDLLPDFQPSEKGVLIHFNTDNIATTLERVLQKGWESAHSLYEDRSRWQRLFCSICRFGRQPHRYLCRQVNQSSDFSVYICSVLLKFYKYD